MAESVSLLDDAEDESGLSLAGSGDIITAFRVNGTQAVQVSQAVRATHAVAKNRGGIVNRIELGVTHAAESSPADAKSAAAALIAAIAAKVATATLVDFTFADQTLRLSDAAIESYEIEPRGVRVFASYTLAGGALAELEAEEP